MKQVTPSAAAQELWEKGRAILVLSHPFFAGVMLKFKQVWTTDIPTAAITSRGRVLHLNPEWVEREVRSASRMVFLLCHECLHYMWLHGARRGNRTPDKWNIAGDAVINETLVSMGVGEFIDGGVRWPGAEKMSAEQVYALLPEPDGNGAGGIGNDLSGEDGEGDGLTEGEQREIEAQVKMDVAQAERVAKMKGTVSGQLQGLIDGIIQVKTPWHAILERFMTALVNESISWKRPSKRGYDAGVYLPGKMKDPGMGTIVLAVDTSASVGDRELQNFHGHIARIIEQCNPERVVAIYCDYSVQRVDEYTGEIQFQMRSDGRGGTSFRPVFDKVAEMGINPDVLVYLTDGEGEHLSSAPDYPVIWVTTTGYCSAQFGEVLHIEVE